MNDMAEYKTYTVDDEDPNCGKCDNIDQPAKFCVNCCGAEHGWWGYQRTVEEEEHE